MNIENVRSIENISDRLNYIYRNSNKKWNILNKSMESIINLMRDIEIVYKNDLLSKSNEILDCIKKQGSRKYMKWKVSCIINQIEQTKYL